MTGKRVLEKLVKSNASLAITIATLTNTNARLLKKVEMLKASLAKKVGGGGELPSREPVKYYPNCEIYTWNKPNKSFELDQNRYKLPCWWKYCLK